MSITQVPSSTVASQAPTGQGPAAPNASPSDATGSNASQNFSKAPAAPSAKPDNDAVKVSLSDTAIKALAANKTVNPDGTVGPHHKARHPKPVAKPVA